MALTLTDFVDSAILEELTKSIWRCSGLPAQVIDPQGRVLVSSGRQDLCFRFHRSHPLTSQYCLESDTKIGDLAKDRAAEHSLLEARCRNGLNHIGLPIIVAGVHLATLFLSQFLYEPPDEKTFRRQARELGFDEEEYLAALRKVPVLDSARVNEVLTFCNVLVRLVNEMGTREASLLASKERLLKSEEKFRHLFQNANDALFIIGPSGRILDVNEMACARLGYSRRELLRRQVKDIDSNVIAKDAELQVQFILKEGTAVFETEHTSRDGRKIPVEISARKIEIEERPAILCIARDLTERKRVEAALRESEERFRNVIDSTPLGVHLYQLVGEELILTGANPAADAILGIAHVPLFGRTLEEAFPPLRLTEIPARYREVCRGTRWQSLEVPYEDEISGIFEVHAFPTGAGRMAVLFADISERKKWESDLLYRERFEALIAAISTRFMEGEPSDLDKNIESALHDLVEFAGVDRAYLFRLSEDGERMSNTHEACSPETSCEIEHLQELPVSDFPWLIGKLRARKIVHIPRISELPPEAAKERAHFAEQQIQSMISVPVLIKGDLGGIVGFDAVHAEKAWDERDIVLLRTFGDLVGSALERRLATDSLEYRARLDHLVATLSTRMLNLEPESVDTAIEAALSEIGSFVGVDRCYVFQFSDDGDRFSNTHEWCAAQITSFKGELQNLPTSRFPWIFGKIFRGETIVVSDTADLDAKAERDEFERQRIRSILCVPMLIEGRVIGFIGFDAVRQKKKWQDDIVLLLRLVGEFFANALERRRKDRELRQAQEQISAILRSLRAGLVGVDRQGRIILLNRPAAKILGLEATDTRGRLIGEFPIEPALRRQIDSVLAGRRPEAVEWTLPSRGGAPTCSIRARTDAVRSDRRKRSGAITLLQDVTNEREIDRLKSEFISTAAHELRTPLASVLGYAELLLNQETFGSFTFEEEREFLEEIYKKAESLTELINDLLDLSRIESGQLVRLTLSATSIGPLIEEVVEDFRRRNPHHRFESRLPIDLPEISFDAAKIRQVMENLLGNAVKFSPPGSRIKVEIAMHPDRAEIVVEDEGVGMRPEVLEHVFDKFYRGSADSAVSGIGLGMTIVKNIVEAHGGTIRVESSPGKGTRVVFALPLKG